jgi:hypothetical protein
MAYLPIGQDMCRNDSSLTYRQNCFFTRLCAVNNRAANTIHIYMATQKTATPVAKVENKIAPDTNGTPTPQDATPATNDAPDAPKDAEPDKPDAPKVEEPTSAKLVEINGKIDAINAEILGGTIKDVPTLQAKMMETFTLQNAAKEEIANIKKLQAEQKAKELRDGKIALVDKLMDARDAYNAVTMDMPQDERDAVTTRFRDARDKVIDLILGSVPKIVPATGEPSKKGSTGAAILERYKALRAEGKNDTEARKIVVSEGHNDGTTGIVVLKYLREIGEKS